MKDKALLALARVYNYIRRDERGQSHMVEIFGGLVVAGILATLLYTKAPDLKNAILNKINCAVNLNCPQQ